MWLVSTFLLILCNASKSANSPDFIFLFWLIWKKCWLTSTNRQLLPESKSTQIGNPTWMICKMLCFDHVAACFLSKRFYILDTCVIFHDIMFFKELSAFIALYFIQGALFPSGRFISFRALYFIHGAFIHGKELLFKSF